LRRKKRLVSRLGRAARFVERIRTRAKAPPANRRGFHFERISDVDFS